MNSWTKLWLDGGWTMVPLFVVCLLIYVSAVRLLFHLSNRGFHKVADQDWMSWVRNPAQGEGEVGEIIRYTQDEAKSLSHGQNRFAEVVAAEVPDVDRRLAFVNIFISAAPLLGLLGTVLGMLNTFQGIAMGGGKMIDTIASGISEALITTEMGLLIALPGLMLSYIIRRKRNEHVAFLARLESYTIQNFRKNTAQRIKSRLAKPAPASARAHRTSAPNTPATVPA
ncbi:MAG: MotA/TolQ/ExbB proton channel family protein [Limisphaerales bacterium]